MRQRMVLKKKKQKRRKEEKMQKGGRIDPHGYKIVLTKARKRGYGSRSTVA